MKKRFISSLIFASSLFATSVVNASDMESFAQRYPTLYQNINWRASNQMLATISALNQVASMAKAMPNEQSKKFIAEANHDIPCLKKFDKTPTLNLMLKTVQTNLSPNDLTILENFYASPAGIFDFSERKKMLLAVFNSDPKVIEEVQKEVAMPENKAKLQQAESFVKAHHTLLEKFEKNLTTPEIKQLPKDYINSCKAII